MSDGYNRWRGLVIRITEERDLESARLLHNDDSVLLQLTDIRHVSQAEQRRWFESVSTSPTARRYSILREEDGQFVGVFRLDDLDLQNRSARVGLDIAIDFRGRGYSKIVYEYFFDYLFRQLGLNRLALVTLASNTIAGNLYHGLGFVEEGRSRQAVWRNGGFVDLVHFGLLRDEYEAQRASARP